MSIPFPRGVPVKGKDLIGREDEIAQITELAQNHQSVVLIAPRRYGKTSIVLEVLSRIKREGLWTAMVDIFQVSSKRELAERITEAVLANKKMPFKNTIKTIKSGLAKALKHIEIKQVIRDFEFIVSFADLRTDEDTLLDTVLDFSQQFAKRHKKNLVFSFDEFGDIDKFDEAALIKKMRSKFQLQDNVTYIFTGSQESLMEQLFANKREAFFRFSRMIHLEVLPTDELARYIVERFKQLAFFIEEKAVGKILFYTKAHPYYSQLICQLTYFSLKGERREIEEEDIDRSLKLAIYSEKSYFDQLWLDLMEKKYVSSVLKGIALERNAPYRIEGLTEHNLYRSLALLEKKGLIKKILRGRYEIRDPLFKQYIKLREEGEIF